MSLTALLSATMGAAFIILPLFMLLGSAVFLLMRFRKARAESIALGKEWAVSRRALRDPATVSLMLLLSGFIVVSFVTGELDVTDYGGLVSDALTAYWDGISEWEDPLSSESISFKGGILICFISGAVVAYALVAHFRTQWKIAERAHLNERLR